MVTHLERLVKDPDAILPYTLEWADWLETGDEINTFDADVPAGLTLGDGNNGAPAPTKTATAVTLWIFGGVAGATYTIRLRITTTPEPAKTDDRSIAIAVTER